MRIELVAITPNAEAVIERAARVCYQSQDRIAEGTARTFLPKLLAMGHESPFEHASATFLLDGCSRAMTHQLVRHRMMSVSQKSQRYVSESGFDYVVPESVPPDRLDDFRRDMETIRRMYARWKEAGLRNEDARFVLPNACATEIMITANFREYRHIFRVRCTRHAQWEIRAACTEMLRVLFEHAPAVFGDLHREFAVAGDSGPQPKECADA
jgi:thymidylate synthase (FAD)